MTKQAQIHDLLLKRSMTTREVAEAMGMKTTTTTVTLCKMRDNGLVKHAGFVQTGNRVRPVVLWKAVK